ncbi:hypothetical protein L6R29_06825 [Myxococcota bacterium]|nr:hypothetical protein [Myxococcota bacterium]
MQLSISVYIRVFLFCLASLLCTAWVVYLIGSATKLFEERGYISANYRSVEGIYEGAFATIAGMNVGVVESVRLLRPDEQERDLAQQAQRREHLRPLMLRRVRVLHLEGIQKKFKDIVDLAEREGKIEAALEQALPKFLRKARVKTSKGTDVRWEVPMIARSLRVRVRVSRSFFSWLGKDSVATIRGKGMLGRAVVDISTSLLRGVVPSMDLPRDAELEGASDAQVVEVIGDINRIADQLRRSLKLINYFLAELGDPVLWRHLKGILEHTDQMLAQGNRGSGLVHDLLTSRRLARDARVLLNDVRFAIRHLADLGGGVSQILKGAQERGTLIQHLLLSSDGRRLLALSQELLALAALVLQEVHLLLKAPQRQGTFVNRMLFDPEAAKMLANIRIASNEMRRIIRKLRNGRGSIGALLYDASAYADLVIMLKNLQGWASAVHFFIGSENKERSQRKGDAQKDKE